MRAARLRGMLLAGALLTAVPALAQEANPARESVHVVAPGETLNGIANRAGVSAKEIAAANRLAEPFVVRAGQKLSIPRKAAVSPKAQPLAPARGDTPPDIAAGKAARTAARTAARVIEARAPSPATSPGLASETSHRVTAGETLGGIAARAKVPRILIAEANGLQPPFDVRVGEVLRIPRTRHHAVRSGDTGFSISMDYAVPWEQIALANNLDPAAPVKAGQDLLIPTLLDPAAAGVKTRSPVPPAARPAASSNAASAARFAWPIAGPIRRRYDGAGSDYHDGLDITAPRGTMVRAAAAGTVAFAGPEKEQFGNLVVIDHGNGWHTAYGFLSRVTVKEGAKVAAGERVGLVGDTGRARGAELHFEVRRDGKPVDPLAELPPERPKAP